MGLSCDTKVPLVIEGDVVRLTPLSHRVHRARELYRQAITQPRTTEDFLRDRRAEADIDEGVQESAVAPAPGAAGPTS